MTAGTSALEVHTPKEIFVANGTQGKLTCRFTSANTTGASTSVSWSFQPEGTDTMVSVGAAGGSWPAPARGALCWGSAVAGLAFSLSASGARAGRASVADLEALPLLQHLWEKPLRRLPHARLCCLARCP